MRGEKSDFYTPIPGRDPAKIHHALATINGGRGATVEEIASVSGVPLPKVKAEMRWGKKGNKGKAVIDRLEIDGKTLYRHTAYYRP